MNNDFQDVKKILEGLREDYRTWISGKAINSICPVTERDIVAEIHSRLKDYCQGKNFHVHCEMKPATSENPTPNELKVLRRIDVAILSDCEGESWLEAAIQNQDRFVKGRLEARYSSVPIRFWHTAIEVKIQSKLEDATEDIKKLRMISDKNRSCNCFLILLNARGRGRDHERIARHLGEGQVTFVEYAGETSNPEKEDTLRRASRVGPDEYPPGSVWAAYYTSTHTTPIL